MIHQRHRQTDNMQMQSQDRTMHIVHHAMRWKYCSATCCVEWNANINLNPNPTNLSLVLTPIKPGRDLDWIGQFSGCMQMFNFTHCLEDLQVQKSQSFTFHSTLIGLHRIWCIHNAHLPQLYISRMVILSVAQCPTIPHEQPASRSYGARAEPGASLKRTKLSLG